METNTKIKHPAVMFCSICGKEIKMGEAYDYSQSKRQTAVFWHKRCYPIRKKNDVYGK